MKYLASHALALAMVQATPVKRADPQGIDVSDYQPDIDWTTVVDNGISFVYIKATEGTSYISPTFSSQYTGATDAGLIHGGYHFAHPDESDGETQANYFLAHGGGWSADGITLPGALDIEHNPNGAECYGLTAPRWLHGLRISPIHTKLPLADWWSTCTGNSALFANDNPLWIADWSSTLGALPAGWAYTSFWQYADSGPNPGDADPWNGDMNGLRAMALGS
ncbi:glycoside hydrolase family 25 protein [Pisolithus microcarpus]|nr:glycoside hydrolase family 25 protein [Pisolithus microcarpus]